MLCCIFSLKDGEACCQDLHLEALAVAIETEVAGHASWALPAALPGCLPYAAPSIGRNQAADQVVGCSRADIESGQGAPVRCMPPALIHPHCPLPPCGASICEAQGVKGLCPHLTLQGAVSDF